MKRWIGISLPSREVQAEVVRSGNSPVNLLNYACEQGTFLLNVAWQGYYDTYDFDLARHCQA